MNQVHASDILKANLDEMAQRAIEYLSSLTDGPDEQMFLHRIQQSDEHLMWCPRAGEFRWASPAMTSD